MSDLRTLMHEAAGLPDHAAAAAAAEADVLRGRRALRRRRVGRISAGSGLVAAAAVGAFAILSPGASLTPSSDTPAASVQHEGATAVQLVAYTGVQPTGYTLDKVPSGWEVQHDDLSLLTLAPAGAVAEKEPKGMVSLVGTIAVSTQNDTGVPSGVQLDDVRVDGQAAVIAHMKGSGDTRTLFLEQPTGGYLTIQVWDGLGWSNKQIAEFAGSVHITEDAKPLVG